MNRKNKRKTFEKGYYKTHACRDTFTCKVCGAALHAGKRRQRPSQPLPELLIEPARGH